MSATFIFIMIGLKIPIALLLYIVWWAIKDPPTVEAEPVDEDGGAKRPACPHPRPHPRRPRPPRRGPHGDPPVPAPARTRAVVARGRRVGS
jgi:hypothetical protein